MNVPAQDGDKACGVSSTLHAYKFLEALESGELDGGLDKEIMIFISGKNMMIDDIDKSV
jgi:hypothetical protein